MIRQYKPLFLGGIQAIENHIKQIAPGEINIAYELDLTLYMFYEKGSVSLLTIILLIHFTFNACSNSGLCDRL